MQLSFRLIKKFLTSKVEFGIIGTMMKRMKVRFSPKRNFHNAEPISIRADVCDILSYGVWVSQRQFKRISDHFCGIRSCRCYSGPKVINYAPGFVFLERDETVSVMNCRG